MRSSPLTDPIIEVAVPVPGLGLLSYRVASGPAPPKGARVRVPLGGRTVVGVVVGPGRGVPRPAAASAEPAMLPGVLPSDEATLKPVTEVLDVEPFVPAAVVDLALWVGEYYASGPGDALLMAMPPSSRQGQSSEPPTVTIATLVPGAAMDPRVRGNRQRASVDLLAASPDGVSLPELAKRGVAGVVVRRLAEQGLVMLREQVAERDPFALDASGVERFTLAVRGTSERALTADQSVALATLTAAADARTFTTILLHGVTGSGKTEVYLRLAAHVLAQGRRVLVLVPEIALTPAVAGAFRAAFGGRVAIQHSGLSPGERHDQWQRIRRGAVDVVIGTRSAVFAPVGALGLIIVDEEHEGAYKQEESPRYHGRDVAVMRGRMDGALVLLGSATPSLESALNAREGRYGLVTLTRRVHDRPLAHVRVVDMRTELALAGVDAALSEPLRHALAERLERGEQSLVLLNRRGFARVIFCRQCAASIECPHCSVTLTFHRGARRLRCHYCNYASGVPRTCGECGGEFLEQSGIGTERLEAEVREAFPSARVMRIDRDTVRRRGAMTRALASIARGEIDIVVGTQMIAKGHDFPAVTLVGVISADVGLGVPDFRASERTFQLLTQVVGRAGRGETPGEAVVQTFYPDHYSIIAASRQDYAAFYAREIEFRQAMHYPPAMAMVNVIVKGRTLEAAMAAAEDLATHIRAAKRPLVLLGPAPAPVGRIKDEYRVQFFLKGRQRRALREAMLAALDAHPELRRRTIVDVDPNALT